MPAFAPILIDDAVGSNGSVNGRTPDILGVGSWVSPLFTGDNVVNISSNTLIGSAATFSNAGINNVNFGPNVQVSGRVHVMPAGNVSDYIAFWFRLVAASYPTTTQNGYRVELIYSNVANETWLCSRFIAGAETTIGILTGAGSINAQNYSTDDEIGITCVETASGTLITTFRQAAASGIWVPQCSFFDNNVSRPVAAGLVGIEIHRDATPSGALDKFSARTISAPIASSGRLWLPASSATPSASPSFGSAASTWERTTNAVRRMAQRSRTGTALASKTDQGSGVNPNDVLLVQFISDPIAAQTVHGHLKGVIRAIETATTINASAQMIAKVVSGDGTTTRGTLLEHNTASGSAATPPEFATALTNRKFPRSWASPGTGMVPVEAQAGDRIVLEIGMKLEVTATTAGQGLSLGDPVGSDNAEDETGTAANAAWMELVAGIEYLPAQPQIRVVGQSVQRAAVR